MRADIHDGQEHNVPFKGRIQKRKTYHLQIVTFGLQRAAGPYRSCHTKAQGISSPGTHEAIRCGLATMESCDGTLCRTGRVVEADIDLCGEPGWISAAGGHSRF